MTFHRGYGPFQSAQMGLYIVPGGLPNPSGNAETGPEFTGIPDTWSQVSVVHIETDLFQTVYQNYRSGNISQEAYDRQLERWTWIPDTSYCSSTPIRCFVGVVSGLDPQGVWKVKVDRNGNLDFRDDVAFELHGLLGQHSRRPQMQSRRIYNFQRFLQHTIFSFSRIFAASYYVKV